MKQLLILGAGTAGTMMANHLRKKVDRSEWKITVVDQYPEHYYQPGFLFLPFGLYSERDVVKPKRQFIPRAVEYVEAEVDQIDPEKNKVILKNGQQLPYDILITIATVGNPAMRVPGAKGFPLPTILGMIPGMSAFATWMMNFVHHRREL